MIAYYPDGKKTPLNNYTDYHIVHKEDGNDELYFSLPTNDPQYPQLMEEMRIEAAGNEWIIKKIYDDDIACELNLDELKAEVMIDYNSGSVTLQTLLSDILPTGWVFGGAGLSTIRRTIAFDYATPYDVLQRAMTVYSCAFVWDVPNKAITVYFPSSVPLSGEYLTDELNLRKLSYQGDTSDFATRLFAFGRDGMTMEDAVVNGERYGKKYVDNNDYSDKVVATVWTDERYTDPTSLYNDAVEKLAAVARPIQSYECDAEDLAKQSPDYAFLAFRLHRKITLIDRRRSLRAVHQIVEYDEYPEQPSRSKVTLASVAPTVNSEIQTRLAEVEQRAQNQAVSEIERATKLLTGAQGGYIVYHFDEDGKPYEMLIMDAPSEAEAVNVWRYNKNGWGYSSTGAEGNYSLAATIDGGIVADYIKSGTIDASLIRVININADNIVSGTLTVGGYGNRRGVIRILNGNGDQGGSIDNTGMYLSGNTNYADGTRYHSQLQSTFQSLILSNNQGRVLAGLSHSRSSDGTGHGGRLQLFNYVDGENTYRSYIDGLAGVDKAELTLTGVGKSVRLSTVDGVLSNGLPIKGQDGTFYGNLNVWGDTTLDGVLDITQRRCSANLSSVGWYRVLTVNVSGAGSPSFVIDLTFTRNYNYGNNELHSIKLLGVYRSFDFSDEISKTNHLEIDKIRYTLNGTIGHIDIHYNYAEANAVSVDFAVHTRQDRQSAFTANALERVADAPSGETVMATYNFATNYYPGNVSTPNYTVIAEW